MFLIWQIQTQACQQVMDEAEKEYKKISEKINGSHEEMKVNLPSQYKSEIKHILQVLNLICTSKFQHCYLIFFFFFFFFQFQATYAEFMADAQSTASRGIFVLLLFTRLTIEFFVLVLTTIHGYTVKAMFYITFFRT